MTLAGCRNHKSRFRRPGSRAAISTTIGALTEDAAHAGGAESADQQTDRMTRAADVSDGSSTVDANQAE